MGSETPSYQGFRFPTEIIAHGVWLYHRFPLSLREVEEMMLARGIVVSHETTTPRANIISRTSRKLSGNR